MVYSLRTRCTEYRGFLWLFWASLGAQMVKNLPTLMETWVQSWGWKDPLKKGMATHSSILAWRMPWTEEPGRSGVARVRSD